jgi:hypothetical protein
VRCSTSVSLIYMYWRRITFVVDEIFLYFACISSDEDVD